MKLFNMNHFSAGSNSRVTSPSASRFLLKNTAVGVNYTEISKQTSSYDDDDDTKATKSVSSFTPNSVSICLGFVLIGNVNFFLWKVTNSKLWSMATKCY